MLTKQNHAALLAGSSVFCTADISKLLQCFGGLVGLVVTHSAAGANGPGFNSPVGRTYLRFNYPASSLAGKQC